MAVLLSGLAAPAARHGGGRIRSGTARRAAALQQGLEGQGGPRVRSGVAHQAGGVHERQADPLAVVGELLAVEIGAEVALVDGDARGPGQGVHPVPQILDDEVAHRPGPIVELEGRRHEGAAARQARRLLPREPALEQRPHTRLAARYGERRLDDAFNHARPGHAEDVELERFLRAEVGEEPALRHAEILGQTTDGEPLEPDPRREPQRVSEDCLARLLALGPGSRLGWGPGRGGHSDKIVRPFGYVKPRFRRPCEDRASMTRYVLKRLLLLPALPFVFPGAVAIPAGIYSAMHPRSPIDYVLTVVNYVGVATPNFMLALVLMWGAFAYLGMSVTGLFSPDFVEAPWSLARVVDLLKHVWLPAVVLGVAGTARLTRVMRANLLDELNKPYVTTARAKGLSEWRLVVRYPARLALNPLVSTIGWYLPALFSGSLIVATVMNLPNIGPLLLRALINQDMYLAGSILLIYCFLTIVGTLISDILLAWLDPRIRFEEG